MQTSGQYLHVGACASTRLNKAGVATDTPQCDQQTPSCGQCIKVEKDCPGYRDMLSLSFRNESDAVIEKAKARAAEPRKSKSPLPRPRKASPVAKKPVISEAPIAFSVSTTIAFRHFSTDGSGFPFTNYNAENFTEPANIPNSPSVGLGPSLEEQGTNYFFANFVTPNTQGASGGPFHYLYDVIKVGIDDLLKACIVATGLAGLSNVSKSSQLMGHAQREYTSALRHINVAVASPIDSIKDVTLIGILVLAIYEATAGAWMLTLKAWTQHINGAAALIRIRGRSQFKTLVGRGVFLQATSHLLVSCVQREMSIPDQILELRNEVFSYNSTDPTCQFMKALDDFTILRAAIRAGALTDNSEIINASLELDARLIDIFINSPADWQYESAYTHSNTDLLYDGYYDIYDSYLVARTWNAMRATRIMLNQTIRYRLLAGFNQTPPQFTTPDYTALFQMCTDNVIALQHDILHSVPQHLGFVNRKPFQNIDNSANSSPAPDDSLDISFTTMLSGPELPVFAEQSTAPLKKAAFFPAVGAYNLMWPLFVAGSMRLGPSDMKSYAIKILRYIGDEVGIAQGRNVAFFMETVRGGPEQKRELVGLNEVL
ncbi:hypothetical protein LOCC1_G003015 [Lachnellula occidentalis]|uniref:Zn(2)-C6 fungal-type domain-containing protein n=1 Tax=Lachnellula occidentalis TaxID=215460 RepID=A0A8H8S4H8_9HELO|nr:hypothetical protein LOCC1_G003015 [Lachnellula occidentalis]